MGIFRKDDDRGIERFFIELADQYKGQLVYKWPDQQIRARSRVTVDMDYVAVFTNSGNVVGTFGPGRHELTEGASGPVAWLVDHLTADGYYDCELYYVVTRQVPNIPFGGPVDHVRDPESGFVAALQVFGEFTAQVVDPVTLLNSLVGSSDLPDDTGVRRVLTGQVLAAVREETADIVSRTGLYGLGSSQQQLEDETVAAANIALAPFGLAVSGFAQLHVTMDQATVDQLQAFTAAKGYAGLAGSYEAYARGQALMNMAQSGGGGEVNPLLLAKMLMTPDPAAPAAPAAPAPAAPEAGLAGQLERLAELHRSGVLDDEEFAAAKRRLLEQ